MRPHWFFMILAILLLAGCDDEVRPSIKTYGIATIDAYDAQSASGMTATLFDGVETFTLEKIAETEHYAVFIIPNHLRARFGEYQITLKDEDGNTSERWIKTKDGVASQKI